MRTLIRAGALALTAVALTACIKTTVTPFAGKPAYGALPPDSVTIYRDAKAVPAPYEQLGVVSAQGDFTTFSEDDVVQALRKEAGRLGGNGLLLADMQSPRGAGKALGVVFGGDLALRRGQAVAIRVRADSTVVR
ncbi:MAG TPA: hypothetical protein VHQ45_00285 [Gemmatimonadaceae bacterium]|jgi:hypothetical protein|nr:hypothetical protein [Gemmatimonadaceae bacterium]